MLRLGLCNFSDAFIVVKGIITVIRPNGAKRNKETKASNLKTMHHLSTAFQKLMV